MKRRSSIFSFETLRLRPRVPRAALLAVGLLLGMELLARMLVATGRLDTAPKLSHMVEEYVDRLRTRQPDCWLMGNSTLEVGIDAEELDRRTGRRSIKLAHGSLSIRGSVAMLRYYLKRVPQAPRTLMLFAYKDDLNRNGYGARMSETYIDYAEQSARERFALADYSLVRAIRYSLAEQALDGWDVMEARLRAAMGGGQIKGLRREGRQARKRPALLDRRFDGAPIREQANFFADLARDFTIDTESLKELGETCRSSGIECVLVLLPVTDIYIEFHHLLYPAMPYGEIRAELAARCGEKGITLLDLGDPSARHREFADPFHMNRAGRTVTTAKLADWLGKGRLAERPPAKRE